MIVYRGCACEHWDYTYIGTTSWTKDRDVAELYAKFDSNSPDGRDRNPRQYLYQAELDVGGVYDVFPGGDYQAWEFANDLRLQAKLKERGYDAMRYMEDVPKLGKSTITLRPFWRDRITKVIML